MEISLKKEIIAKVFSPIIEKGFSIFFVGGCVRDSVLQIEPHDYDFVCNATPKQLHTVFSTFSKKSINSEKFGITIPLIELQGKVQGVEIATFRKDVKTGRHPEVVYADTIKEDCWRRDFTINALYEDVHGNIFDPTGQGRKDLVDKTLRFIGNPIERVLEDPLRPFRFVRLMAQRGFSSCYTISELESFAEQLQFEVSKERELEELKQIFAGKYFTKPEVWEAFFAFGIAKEVGIDDLRIAMQHIRQSYRWHAEGSLWFKDGELKHFEDFKITWKKGVPENAYELKHWVPVVNGNVWDHTKLVVQSASKKMWEEDLPTFNKQDRFEIVLAAFLHDIGKAYSNIHEYKHNEYVLFEGTPAEIYISETIPKVSDHPISGVPYVIDFCKKLKLSTKETDFIINVVKHHMIIHTLLDKNSVYEKREILNLPQFEKLAIIGCADDEGSLNMVPNERGMMENILADIHIQKLIDMGPLEPPILTGWDLIEMGRKPSPIFPKVLKAAHRIQINKNITDKKVLYRAVKNLFKEKNV